MIYPHAPATPCLALMESQVMPLDVAKCKKNVGGFVREMQEPLFRYIVYSLFCYYLSTRAWGSIYAFQVVSRNSSVHGSTANQRTVSTSHLLQKSTQRGFSQSYFTHLYHC